MKKTILSGMAATIMLAACQQNEVLVDSNGGSTGSNSEAISFGLPLPDNGSRTALSHATGFPVGSVIAVDGFQTNDKQQVFQLFTDQAVEHSAAGTWTYSPVRYWDIKSTYVFYAFYPHSMAHTFDTDSRTYAVTSYTVPDSKDSQEDIMIAQENHTLPLNLVTLNFNHILSQVNFYFKASSNFSLNQVEKVELTHFDVTGIRNEGSYAQTGFNATTGVAEGQWTLAANSGLYDFPEVTAVDPIQSYTDVATIEDGLLMLPQGLNDVWAEISYKIVYDNGSQSAYSARVNLAKVKVALRNSTTTSVEQIDRWKPNFVYNYYFAFDPSKPNTDSWTIDYNGSTGGDGTPIEGATLVQDEGGNFIGVDIDGDGQADYPLAWEDIDGDGKEEGGIDRDGDGHIDNVDGENVNHADPSSPAYGSVTDGNANNPGGGDVILIDTDGDGICETQLETLLPISTAIEFSAEIEEWEGTYDAVVDAQ